MKLNHVHLTIFVVGLLFGSSISYYYSFAAIPSTVIEAGSNIETATYVIYTDNSTTWAKNGATGAMTYSSADAYTTIQNAINATSRGKIFIREGTYNLSSSLLLKSNITLQGEGPYQTRLRLADGVNDQVITTLSETSVYAYITVRDLGVDGNKDNNPGGLECLKMFSWRSLYENLYVHHCASVGIRIQGIGASHAIENIVAHNVVMDTDGIGVLLDSFAPDNHVHDNQVGRANIGIEIRAYDSFIVNNHVYRSDSYGINGKNCDRSRIIGNFIETSDADGVRLFTDATANLTHVVVGFNSFFNNSQGPAITYDAIALEGLGANNVTDIIIVGNDIAGIAHDFGVHGTLTDYILIDGNNFRNGYSTSAISVAGWNNNVTTNMT